MNLWISENFLNNKKVNRLRYELGADSVLSLLQLWFYALKYAVDNLLDDDKIGVLKDFDDLDIEMVANWNGEKGVFINSLKSLKLIEKKYSQYFIHDFLDNNPQISVLIKQKLTGSKYAKRRWEQKRIGDPMGDPLSTPIGDLMQTEKKRKEKKVIKEKEKEKTSLSGSEKKKPDRAISHVEIIDFLNETCGTKYKHTTLNTQKFIKARIKEGFTLGDFKTVISKQHQRWNNTDMVKYLRPETLFGTKFEGYLNEIGAPCEHNNISNIDKKSPQNKQNGAFVKKLKFNELEYPMGIDSLVFNSPVEVRVHLTSLNEPQKIALIGRLKGLKRTCDCGQAYLTDTDRKSCYRCDQTSPEDKKKLEVHRKRMRKLEEADNEEYPELTPEQRQKNIKEARKIIEGMGRD